MVPYKQRSESVNISLRIRRQINSDPALDPTWPFLWPLKIVVK
jgi:hypothetical protein